MIDIGTEFRNLHQPVIKKRHIPTKLIDQKPLNPRGVRGTQNRLRPHKLRNHPTPINVAGQNNRQLRSFCKSHIGDIAGPQIDFSGAARTFDQNNVCVLTRFHETFEDVAKQTLFQIMKEDSQLSY